MVITETSFPRGGVVKKDIPTEPVIVSTSMQNQFDIKI